MTLEDPDQPLAVPPGDPLGTFIMLRDWPRAIEEVSRRLEGAETPRRRGFYHLFLATLYKMVVKGAKRRRQTDVAADYRDRARAAYLRSLEEDPHNITARLSFAEFNLRHLGDADAAIPLLHPFEAPDYSSTLTFVQQEHKRRALLGAAHALRGEADEAHRWMMRAYGDAEFHRDLSYSYNTIFWTLILHRVKLPAGPLEEVLGQLRAFRNYKPRNVLRFRAEIAAPEA